LHYFVDTPTRVVGVNDKVKLIMMHHGFGYDFAGCVLEDNTVLSWGTSFLPDVIDYYDEENPITDISAGLPSGVNVVYFAGC
jgi:hypothetical protein